MLLNKYINKVKIAAQSIVLETDNSAEYNEEEKELELELTNYFKK